MTSEEEDEKEFNKRFPFYKETNREPNLEDDNVEIIDDDVVEEEDESTGASTIAMILVSSVHEQLFTNCVGSNWYRGENVKVDASDLRPFLLKYSVGSQLLEKVGHLADSSLDAKLLLGHFVSSRNQLCQFI